MMFGRSQKRRELDFVREMLVEIKELGEAIDAAHPDQKPSMMAAQRVLLAITSAVNKSA
jgi:hypothetical protein